MGFRLLIVLHGGEILDVAQIVECDKALFFVARENLRHIEHGEDFAHAHIGFGVHFFGRGVHADNASPVGKTGAEITAEIGVGGGEFEGEFLAGKLLLQPTF